MSWNLAKKTTASDRSDTTAERAKTPGLGDTESLGSPTRVGCFVFFNPSRICLLIEKGEGSRGETERD